MSLKLVEERKYETIQVISICHMKLFVCCMCIHLYIHKHNFMSIRIYVYTHIGVEKYTLDVPDSDRRLA